MNLSERICIKVTNSIWKIKQKRICKLGSIYRGEHSTGISWPPAFEEATSPHIKVASLKKPYQRAKRRGATYRLTRSTEPTKKTKKNGKI